MTINDSILFCILKLEGKSHFERIMKECFTLFPEKFGFPQYAKWPDARKIDKPLRDLRRKGLIKGNPSTFFELTKEGKKQAVEITKIVRQKKLL